MKRFLSLVLTIALLLSIMPAGVFSIATSAEAASSTDAEFTITWRNSNGELLGTTSCDYGETPIFGGETPVRESDSQYTYTFTGWQPEVKAAYSDADYIAVYSKTARNSYTITYNANGGSNAPASQTKAPGQTIKLNSSEPTWQNHVFLGWSCAYNDTLYQAEENFNVDADVTLYAVWKDPCSYCDGKGGSYTYSTCTTCNGTGDGSIVKCAFCYGTGRKCANCGNISVTIIQGLGQVCSSCGSTSRRNCASCNGVGTWTTDYCTTCGGDGTTSSYSSCYWCDGDKHVETSFSRYVYLYSDDSLTGSKTIYTKRPYQLIVPSKTGYTFIGWFDSPDGGTQYTNGEGVSLSVCPDSPSSKLYAHWSLNYYTITYDCEQNVNTDDMPAGYTVEDEDFILNSQSPREHYNFYWSVLGTKVESFDTSIAQDVVVKGVWDPINYTITYNLDGGTANNRTTYNIETDTFSLVEPTKAGYIFTGWTGSNGNVPEKNVTISTDQLQNLSFTANWTIAVYTITYELFGGENSLKNPTTFTMNDNVVLKNATKDYYTFAGWYLDSSFTKKITNINGYHGDLTLYARFAPTSSTAKFDSGEGYFSYNITIVWGGNLQNEILNYKSGDIFYPYEVDVPSRSGYLFNGFYLDSSFGTPLPETYTVTTDITLYAKWFAKAGSNAKELTSGDYRYACSANQSKRVYFYVSPERAGETLVSYYLYGYEKDVNSPARTPSGVRITDLTIGKEVFFEWSASSSYYLVNSSDYVTLVAGHTYELYVYACGSSGEADVLLCIGSEPFPTKWEISSLATLEEKYEQPTQYPVPLRDDYDFVGWYDIDGNPIQNVWDYTTDKTFYPQWKLHEFTIDYNLNGGINSSLNPSSYTVADSALTLINPTKEGYTFLGWYTDPNFQNQITEINCEDRLNYTLYAKWISDFFTVNYELNGGINNPSNKQRIGRTEEFTLMDPTREGYTFAGWYLESYYSTKVTTLCGSAHRDQKVYAKWTPNSYTAMLDYSGGQNCPTVEFVSQGTVIKTVDLYKDTTLSYFTPEAPAANLKFAGWYTNSSYTTLFNFNGIVNYDVTVHAKWVSVNTNYEYVSLGGSYDVSISGIESQYLAIMSPITQTVTVSSVSGLDLFGSIYDSNMNLLYSCDDISDENLDFSITFVIEAGKVYYIAYKANQVFVSGNATINISGTQNPSTFITGDYTEIIECVNVIYASSFALPIPKRNGYVFRGWFDENDTQITDGTWNFAANKTLTAKWAECYTVIFKDFAGNIISIKTHCFGEEIVAPEPPAKAPDETYIYHTKWDNDYTGICTGDAVYSPTFDLEYIEYTVVFVDEDGTELSRETYHWGDVVTPPAAPTKAVDANYANIYTFAGWDNAVVNCAGDATYVATYTAVPLKELVLISQPNQVRYRTRENLNLTGLALQCVYANDASISLNSANAQFVSADLSTPGRKAVTITIAGKSIEFEIYVHDAEETVVNVDSSLYPQSSHNYSNNLDETKTFTYSGAESLVITFNSQTSVENNYDYIFIYDGAGNQIAKYTGTTAANKTLTITGDTFKVRLTSDYSNVKYGYAFSSIQANMNNAGEIIHQPVTDPATVTCTQSGLTEGSHCEICGDVLVAQEEVAALGHNYKTVFTWSENHTSCTVTITCERDCGFSEELNCTVTHSEPNQAQTMHTAVAELDGESFTDVLTCDNFLIDFRDWDGTQISSTYYHAGDTVTIPSAPNRAADNTYTYTFAGWDQAVVDCAGNATYTATYSSAYIDYTVAFKNWDGTVLSAKTYHWGEHVTTPSNPTRSADDTYTYTFAGWDNAVVECAGDAMYTATYSATYIDYTVVFVNWNGGVLSNQTYHYGDKVTEPINPAKAADSTYTYAFAGWDKDVVNCAGNVTYTALYTATYINYTVAFKNWDGSVVSAKTYHYGDAVTAPANPTRPNDERFEYTFVGWDKEIVNCAGNATYTAVYASELLIPTTITSDKYTISGGVISKIELGTKVSTLIGNLNEDAYVKVFKGATEVSGDALIGTGMVVKIMDGDTVVTSVTVVVTGDTNGDGKLTVTDFVQMQAHLLNKTPLQGAAAKAADTSGDGKISVTDYVQMQAHILGKSTVQPRSV